MRHAALCACLAALLATPARAQEAVTLEAAYTAEVRAVVLGGEKKALRYLDNLDVIAALDGDEAGLPGTSAQVYLLYNNGKTFSDSHVGDHQILSNIETGTRAVRVFEAWVDQKIRRASLRAGLYDLNSEFDAHDTAGLFVGSSHGIGPDFSQSGENGPSIFPVTSLALRADWRPSDSVTLRAAVLDGVPGDPARPRRTAIKLGNGDGALLVGEATHSKGGLRLGLGHWRYTAKAPALIPGRNAAHNGGTYGFAEARLHGGAEDGAGSLNGWLRVGAARPSLNLVSSYWGGGLVWQGVGMRQAKAGIAVAHARFARGHALEHPGHDAKAETAIEATWLLPVHRHFSVQPDVQLILNRGGRTRDGTALVLGLRLTASY